MQQAPAEVMLKAPEATRSEGVLGRVGRRIGNVVTGVAVTAGSLLGSDTARAQETVPIAPELVKKAEGKEKHPPPNYEQTVALTHKLGSGAYHIRYGTALQMKNLFADSDVGHRMMVWAAPEKDGKVLERTRQIEELERMQMGKSLARYSVDYSNDWVDGTQFDDKGCEVRLPPMWPGAEALSHYQITRHYLEKAEKRGAKNTKSPDWERHRIGLQVLAEELRDHYGPGELWNDASRKAFDEWNRKNPKGDKGKWLLESFDERMRKRVLPKIEKMLEPYKRGSETYRKNSNLPLKRPMGPILRNGIIDPATVSVVQPEVKQLRKAG